jgi:hypothetical protein
MKQIEKRKENSMPIKPQGKMTRHKGFSPGLMQFFQVNE